MEIFFGSFTLSHVLVQADPSLSGRVGTRLLASFFQDILFYFHHAAAGSLVIFHRTGN